MEKQKFLMSIGALESSTSYKNNTSNVRVSIVITQQNWVESEEGIYDTTASHMTPLTISCNGEEQTIPIYTYDFRDEESLTFATVTFKNIEHDSDGSKTVTISAEWSPHSSMQQYFDPSTLKAQASLPLTTFTRDRTVTVTTNGEVTFQRIVTTGTTYSIKDNTLTFSGSYQAITVTKPQHSGTTYYADTATWSCEDSGTITTDTDITAIFEVVTGYTVTLSKGNGIASVTPNVTTSYTPGYPVTISATPADGYVWQQWSDGNKEQTRTFTIESNISLTAYGDSTDPTCTINANRRVASTTSTTLSEQGNYAYINFTAKDGSSAISTITVDGNTPILQLDGTYSYWASQTTNVATTYTIVLTDALGDHKFSVFIPTSTIPTSQYDDSNGNVGFAVGMFANPNYIGISKGNTEDSKPMTISAYSDLTEIKDKTRVEVRTTSESSMDAYSLVRGLAAYPVGSIYMSVNSTSPATLFGGTWEAISQGRVLLGAGTGTDQNGTEQTFSAGSSSGEYTHGLSSAEMPPHTHGISSVKGSTTSNGGHGHNVSGSTNEKTLSGSFLERRTENGSPVSGSFSISTNAAYGLDASSTSTTKYMDKISLSYTHSHSLIGAATYGDSDGEHSHSVSVSGTTNSTGGSNGNVVKHNIIQPYLVVYMWKRTA